MATVNWSPNGQIIAQVDTFTVTTFAVAETITVTVNTKSITYTGIAGDTTTLGATGLFNALNAAKSLVTELNELVFTNPSAGVVVATAAVPGTPFTLTSSAGGGAAMGQAHTTANSSNSDVNNANNWLRAGVAGLPQNGDDVIVADTSVPLLWNLSSLSAIQFNTFRRWQSFTGTIGLPENNPNGYVEYRPTYFQFTGPPAGTLQMKLGEGQVGGGPSRERYNVGGQLTNLVVLASGGAVDDYAIRFLGTNAGNTVSVVGTSLGVAMLPAETASLTSVTIDGGGFVALGSGVTISGAVTLTGASCILDCAPGTIDARQGSRVTLQSATTLTYTTVKMAGGSVVTWLCDGTITTLTLQTGSVLDKSQDLRTVTITNSTIDGDSCQVLDPLNTITWTNATTVNNSVSSGPFTFQGPRTVKVT